MSAFGANDPSGQLWSRLLSVYGRMHTLLFAQVCGRNTDLYDSSFVDAGNTYIFENLVIDLALACTLDHDVLAAVEYRRECRCLWLLWRVRDESEVPAGIGQISVLRRIGDPELLYGRSFSNAFQNRINCVARHTCFFCESHEMCGQQSFANHMPAHRVLTICSL